MHLLKADDKLPTCVRKLQCSRRLHGPYILRCKILIKYGRYFTPNILPCNPCLHPPSIRKPIQTIVSFTKLTRPQIQLALPRQFLSKIPLQSVQPTQQCQNTNFIYVYVAHSSTTTSRHTFRLPMAHQYKVYRHIPMHGDAQGNKTFVLTLLNKFSNHEVKHRIITDKQTLPLHTRVQCVLA